jgi:hypothetical protein
MVLAWGLALLVAGPALADKAAEEIIDKAVEAHGGLDKLAGAKRMIRKAEGKTTTLAGSEKFSDEFTAELPDRYRLELTIGEQKNKLILVINKDQGWFSSGGTTQALPREAVKEHLGESYSMYLTTLAPLKQDRSFKLTALPKQKVGGKAALGVRVEHKGHDAVDLYFDEDSRLLVKMTRKTVVAGLGVDRDYLYSDYKDFDGIKLPAKQTQSLNGQEQVSITSTKYSFPEKVDEKTFQRP